MIRTKEFHLFQADQLYGADVDVDVSVEAKLICVEPGHRLAHSPSSSRTPGIPYQDTMKTSVRMLKTLRGHYGELQWGAGKVYPRY